MKHISNFLKNVWQSTIQQQRANNSFISQLLLCCTIPLALGINNGVLIGTLLIVIFTYKKEYLGFSRSHIPLLLFFIWSACSYVWTIDSESTLRAIPKGLVLILIPLFYSLKKPFNSTQKTELVKWYSYVMVLFVFYYLTKAVVRYFVTGNPEVFFYHELVTLDVNAIHASVFVSMAFFYFLKNKGNSQLYLYLSLLLYGFILLLSSKNIILVVTLVAVIKYLYDLKSGQKLWISPLFLLIVIVIIAISSFKIKERFFDENLSKDTVSLANGVQVVTIEEAWSKKQFTPNHYFPGTAFRVYQNRMFVELLKEESIFWLGFGLNASFPKLKEKALEYKVFMGDETTRGYHLKNFHNQYVQNFADLGFIGFIILLVLVLINLKNGINHKDFMHIVFAVLMISLFLTESFLWRQRGMVFFVSFYVFFNSNYSKKTTS